MNATRRDAMKALRIPFNRQALVGREREYVATAMESRHSAGDGPFTRRCHELLTRRLGTSSVLLTTSCTDALEMSALLLDLRPGDEVIIPSFTFVSSVNAFMLRGVTPIFADCRPDTLNIDENQLESLISPRTRAIVPVHYAGVGCEMDRIMEIARMHGVHIVEDNAHALLGRYRGKLLGTFGTFAAQSFHETKNFSCGEGGALVINDPAYIERAEIIREKGTNRSRFFRGEVDKYTWVDVGSSFLPSDILAAYLLAQLESEELIQSRRRAVWERYDAGLADWAAEHGVRRPTVPAHCDQSWHMYYVLIPDAEQRQQLISHLRQRDILAVFHYLPLHLSDMGRALGGREGTLPVTESVTDQLLRLPLYNDMPESDVDYVIESILAWRR